MSIGEFGGNLFLIVAGVAALFWLLIFLHNCGHTR